MKLRILGPLVAASLMMLAGCGKGAKANKQATIAVEAPPPPKIQGDVFALSGENNKKVIGYKSTMLLLNPTGSPQLLADVIRVSEDTRIKAGESRAFMLKEARFLAGGSAEADVVKKKEDLKTFTETARKNAREIPLDQRQLAAKGWFDAKLLQLALPTDLNVNVQSRWANYCDSKIVELAGHPTFARLAPSGYSQRPSPQQMCEAYYEQKGYFQGPSCLSANYFTCIWVEGVMKSGTFLNQTGVDLTTKLKAIFDSPANTEIFRKLLQADKAVASEAYIKAPTGIIDDHIYNKKQYFDKILLGKPSIGSETNCKALLSPTYAFICGDFGKYWKAKTPAVLMTEIESDRTFVDANPSLKIVIDSAKYFGLRPVDGALQSSISDVLFQAVIAPNVIVAPDLTKQTALITLEDITAVTQEFTGKVLPDLNSEDVQAIADREADIKSLQDEIVAKRAENDRLTAAANEAIQAGIRAATAGDVAFAFLSYLFNVKHYDDTIMRATLTFDGFPTQFFEGCFDKKALVPVDCPAPVDKGANDVMHKAVLNVLSDKGRIDFSFVVDNPTAVGLGYSAKNPKSPQYFMDLQPEVITGTTLRFELYPNRLYSALDILTGKALFNRDGQDIYEAGLSMWEL